VSVSPISADAYAVTASIDGRTAVVPRSLANADYVSMLQITGTLIASQQGVYNAFPDLRKIGTSLVGIYSSGAGHGNSDRQIMVRSDDSGATWTAGTFFEDAGAVFTNTLLDGLMSTGDKQVFKVFTVEKTSDGYSNTTVSTVANGGLTYALWSQPINVGGTLYRTGYAVNGSDTQTALFRSLDGGVTWAFLSLIAAVGGRLYSEAGLTRCANGDFIAVIRQDGFNSTRPLWFSRSTDSGATWSAPTQFPTSAINGTQPFLLTLSTGDVLLMAGDRVGSSGIGNAGLMSGAENFTGISAWRSSDHGATWTSRTMLAPMWSTDGGQPVAVEISSTSVGFLCYLAPGPTNNDVGTEPQIWFFRFNPSSLV
jgi:hypothetical protein